MATIAQNLQTLINERDAIKTVINNNGGSVGNSLGTYKIAIYNIPKKANHLCFYCIDSVGATISFTKSSVSGDLSYSFGTSTWTTYSSPINLAFGQKVWIRGDFSSGLATSNSNYSHFTITGKVAASGNIMSLLGYYSGTSTLTIPADYCFRGLFMNCEDLVTAPELPATTLKTQCYSNMFSGCTGLVVAPELPATTLATGCYFSMFYGCTSLTVAPVLPALTTVNSCYRQMFLGCSNLKYIKSLNTNIASLSLSNWVNGVAASGTFVKNSSATWTTTGTSGVPTGWTVETASS